MDSCSQVCFGKVKKTKTIFIPHQQTTAAPGINQSGENKKVLKRPQRVALKKNFVTTAAMTVGVHEGTLQPGSSTTALGLVTKETDRRGRRPTEERETSL